MPDFAIGLPKKYRKGNITDLQPDAFYTLVQQLHRAKRAGKHIDLRIGNESGLQSWAVRKGMPEQPGEKRLGIKQPVHRYSYKDFVGRIPDNQYGAGTVEKVEESPVIVLKSSPNHLMFTRGNTKNAPIYDMVNTGGDSWLITIRKHDEPPVVKRIKKEHFKAVPMEKVPDLIDAGAAITPKIDGAGTRLYLDKSGIKAYGIRPDKEGNHPSYTDVIGGLRSARVPAGLEGTILRGELYGVRNGKPIHPNQLAALLNSTLANAVDKKRKTGTRLLVAALAVNKNGIDDYTADVKSITDKLNHPAIHSVPMYTGDAAKKLVSAISSGQFPLTREGVVIHQPGKRPLKAKNLEDLDVVIRDIFPAETDGEPRAGGFTYSYPGSDEIKGRVGTGFDRNTAIDMLNNPQNYIGRTARVHSQEVLPSGALRAPGFIAMKED